VSSSYSPAQPVARLTVRARPEVLALCRHALAGALTEVAIDEDAVEDLKLVLSELCKNAIEHAYAGAEGVIDIEFRISPDEFVTAVRDHGRGVAAGASRGTGWSALASLTSRYTIAAAESGGTLVTFARSL
jgi:anti-sigma regulatory factor (Ser/Thr protein kinase)